MSIRALTTRRQSRRANTARCRVSSAVGTVLVVAVLASSPAKAQFVCTTTSAGVSCTNSGTSGSFSNTATGANQNATTTNSGTVNGSVATETAAGGNATGTNSGTVTQSFFVQTDTGGDAKGTNSGAIGNAFGIGTIAGGNAIGTNSGSVGQDFQVFTLLGGNATGTNAGNVAGSFLISTTGGGDAAAVNSGSVGQTVTVETVAGGNASGINSGSIGQSFQVFTFGGGNATAVNSGTIDQGASLAAFGTGTSSLTNSGIIRNTTGGPAIQFAGGPDTLNLLTGSIIVGDINLVGTRDTVDFLSGNHNLTFGGPGLSGATVTGAIPFAVSGNRAAAIDPTPFALADKNLMDFTRGVSSVLASLGGTVATPNGPLSSAFAPAESGSMAATVGDAFATIGSPALTYADDQAPLFKAPTLVDQYGRSIWARGFGGEHLQDADGPLVRSTTTYFGGAAGFDMIARPDLRLGLFAGGGEVRQSLDLNAGHTDTDTGFGGIYGRYGFVSFGTPSMLDFALHGGGSTNRTSRTVNNNVLTNGVEIATATYGSSYVSPEAKYSVYVPLLPQYTLTPSFGVRYVAGFLGGYTESGTTAPLTVASRTIQDIEERAELKLTRAMPVGPDRLLTNIYVGTLGIERLGDTTVDTVLLATSVPFIAPGKSNVAGVLGGGGLEWRTREGWSLFGAAEAIGFSDSSTVYQARGGIRVAF